MAVKAADCHALTTYYVNLYKNKTASAPVVNRNTARWGFDGVLQDMSMSDAKALLDFYFTTASRNYALDWFFYNYDKLIVSKQDVEKDAARTKKIREESEQRAKEWRESGKRGISGN